MFPYLSIGASSHSWNNLCTTQYKQSIENRPTRAPECQGGVGGGQPDIRPPTGRTMPPGTICAPGNTIWNFTRCGQYNLELCARPAIQSHLELFVCGAIQSPPLLRTVLRKVCDALIGATDGRKCLFTPYPVRAAPMAQSAPSAQKFRWSIVTRGNQPARQSP